MPFLSNLIYLDHFWDHLGLVFRYFCGTNKLLCLVDFDFSIFGSKICVALKSVFWGGCPFGNCLFPDVRAARVSSAAPKKKSFDRGGPVWPPRSNVTNDRLWRSLGGFAPPAKIWGVWGAAPPSQNRKIQNFSIFTPHPAQLEMSALYFNTQTWERLLQMMLECLLSKAFQLHTFAQGQPLRSDKSLPKFNKPKFPGASRVLANHLL